MEHRCPCFRAGPRNWSVCGCSIRSNVTDFILDFFVSALVHYPQARGSVMIRGSFSKARDSIESVKELLVEKVSFAKFQLRIKGPRVFLREQNTEFWTVTIIYMVMEKGL